MASRRFESRGLTLIEVLLAVALLAALAAISVGIIRDARLASNRQNEAFRIDAASWLIDEIADDYARELYELLPSQSWRPPIEFIEEKDRIGFERVPCDDCPDGFGRYIVTADTVSLVRFYKVKPAAEESP